MNPQRFSWCRRTGFVLAGLLASMACVGSQAHAQPWLPDRNYTEGPGIRIGDLELHPGVAVRGGYDTNVFLADGDVHTAVIDNNVVELTSEEQGSAVLAVTPHLHLSTLSQLRRTQGEDRESDQRALPPIAFRAGLAATYLHYFLDEAPKNLAVDTDLWMGILPQRPFNVDVTVAYTRNVRPFTQYAGDKNAYNYNMISPRIRMNFGSRSQVLTSYVGYAPRVMLYESEIFDYLNYLTHGIEAGAAWKFLPNTALVYDGVLELQDYSEDDPLNSQASVVFSNNKLFRTRLGINGALTRSLSLRALAGYAAVVIDDTNEASVLDDHEDVIAEAVLNWRFGAAQGSSLELGYKRDLLSSSLGGWTRLDRGYLTLRALIARVFLLSLEGGVAYVKYGSMWGYDRRDMAVVAPLGFGQSAERDDLRVDGAVRAEYRVTNWLALMADVSMQAVITDFDYALYFGNSPQPDPADYLQIMAFGGIRAHY